MGLPKQEIRRIKFTKDAKDIRRENLGKVIKKDTEIVCSGKALALFLKAGVAIVIPQKKTTETIEKIKNDK